MKNFLLHLSELIALLILIAAWIAAFWFFA